MSWLKKLPDLLTGGLASAAMDTIKAYLPPDLSPEQQANIELSLKQLELKRQQQAARVVSEAEHRLTRRIAELEGTAKDLKSIPVVGALMLFLRGCQRPVWGFATLYLDVMWLSGQWDGLSTFQERTLFFINVLVLIFLFGERAVVNGLPLVERMMTWRTQGDKEK